MTTPFEYIRCHGSGNRFILIDTLRDPLRGVALDGLARALSRSFSTDGILLLTGTASRPGMRMFNPDGSEAAMCGNGIRCVARLAAERLGTESFVLRSGGRDYPVFREEELSPGVETFGVDIAVGRTSADFPSLGDHIARPIPELDPELRFSLLDPGNPHAVAQTDAIAPERLEALAARLPQLRGLFPNGINLSLYRRIGEQRLYVMTYERGAGITHSCGTAMTSSTTAACLTGLCRFGEPVDVLNRGGRVRCLSRPSGDGCLTRLTGNATFEERGRLSYDDATGGVHVEELVRLDAERAAYARLLEHCTLSNP